MADDRSSPQFHISVTRQGSQQSIRVGVDVNVLITSFAFEDAEKTQKLAFEVDNFDLSQFDNPTFTNGDTITFSYGYDGNMSLAQSGVVMNAYGGSPPPKKGAKHVQIKSGSGSAEGGSKLKIEALGKEILMNKDAKTRSFTNMRRSDVARQIAKEQGFSGANVTVTDVGDVQAVILQSRMTDYALLRQLAQKDGCEVFIDATGFHYHRRKLGQPPVKTLTYYTDSSGTIQGFTVHQDRTAKPGAVTHVARDPLKKTPITASGDDSSTSGRPSLAPVATVIGEKVVVNTGAIVPDSALNPNVCSGAIVASTATTQADAQAQADGAYMKTQAGAVRLKLHCIGDPEIRAKLIIGVQGIGSMHSGNYYVTSAKHTITSSGYTMDLECRRDGTNSGTGNALASPPMNSGKVNTAYTPPGSASGLVPVAVTSADGLSQHVEWRAAGSTGAGAAPASPKSPVNGRTGANT